MVAQVSHDFVWVSRDGRFSHEEFVSTIIKTSKTWVIKAMAAEQNIKSLWRGGEQIWMIVRPSFVDK